jgi:hypothetical protein
MVEDSIRYAMDGCDRDNPTMMLLGAAWTKAQKARQAPDAEAAQSRLWECYDVINAGWRDSTLNNDEAPKPVLTVVGGTDKPRPTLHRVKSDD